MRIPSKIKKRRVVAGLITTALVGIIGFVTAQSATGQSASQLVATINSYSGSAGGTGSISATVIDSQTVRVVGDQRDVSKGLALSIDSGVTVKWGAYLTAAETLPVHQHLVDVTSTVGVFEVVAGGNLSVQQIRSGSGSALRSAGAVVLNGGAIRGSSWVSDSDALSARELTVLDLSGTQGGAVRVSERMVQSGGTLYASNVPAVILGTQATLVMTGGKMQSSAPAGALSVGGVAVLDGGTLLQFNSAYPQYTTTGSGLVISREATTDAYLAGTSSDLALDGPVGSTAVWTRTGGGGIAFTRTGGSPGTVPVPDVTVVEKTGSENALLGGTSTGLGSTDPMAVWAINGVKPGIKVSNGFVEVPGANVYQITTANRLQQANKPGGITFAPPSAPYPTWAIVGNEPAIQLSGGGSLSLAGTGFKVFALSPGCPWRQWAGSTDCVTAVAPNGTQVAWGVRDGLTGLVSGPDFYIYDIAVIERTGSTNVYLAGSSAELKVTPPNSTVSWALSADKSQTGVNLAGGFLPVAGVTVVHRNVTTSTYFAGSAIDLTVVGPATAVWALGPDGEPGIQAGAVFFPIAGVTVYGSETGEPPTQPVFPLSDYLMDSLPFKEEQTGSLTIIKMEEPDTGLHGDGTPARVTNRGINGVEFEVARVTGCPGIYGPGVLGDPWVEFDLNDPVAWTQLNTRLQAMRGFRPKTLEQAFAGCEFDEKGAETAVTTTIMIGGKTRQDGVAQFAKMQVGVYRVTETNVPAGVMPMDAPFLVTIPLPNGDGTDWIFDVVVQPKNQVNRQPVLTVVDASTVKLGDKVTWHETFPIPHRQVYSYTIAQTLDGLVALDCPNEVQVSAPGISEALVRDRDYVCPIPGSVTIELTSSGLVVLNQARGGTIEVTLGTKATDPGVLSNTASYWVNTNPQGPASGVSNLALHKVGSLAVAAVDGRTDAMLAGVEFQVWVDRNGNGVLDGADEQVFLGSDWFWITVAVGRIDLVGLRYSDFANNQAVAFGQAGYQRYFVKAITAPDGYQMPDEPVVVNADLTGEQLFVDIPFARIPTNLALSLPLIGGNLAPFITILGLALLIGGLTYTTRRTRAKQA